ncbi:MAG: RluA family pseudouridine synthase [Planctomycetota bacterium]|jgi:23S rRNA pseudouridine955/2504/2580 synthase
MAKKPPSVTLRITSADAGVRLDRLLRKLLPDVPLSGVHRMIRKGGALVDGVRARERTRLAEGSELSLALEEADAAALRERLASEEAEPDARPAPGFAAGFTPVRARIPVIHEDAHVLAFDKPSGVAAHPGSGHHLEDTVLGALYARVGKGTATFTPALVGRLDRDTSGVQLAGISPEGLRGLSALSRSREIVKTYLALVRGEGGRSPGRIDSSLVDSGAGRARMRALPAGEEAEGALEAITEYRALSRGGGASLVEVRPLTGRRHQIRAHFTSIGAPVAGDVRYGDRDWNRKLASRAQLERLFLHCTEARFAHPVTSSDVLVGSPLPGELGRTLQTLGISL